MMHACATLVPLLSGGALAGLAFLAILAFGLLAVMSLTRHIRRSHAPWPGEVDGGVPLVDDPDEGEGQGVPAGPASTGHTEQGSQRI